MTETHFISDTHFGHHKIAREFTQEDGSPARINPNTGERFSSVEDMDEFMIANWNSKVSPKDRVYHLGDFCMNRKSLKVFHRLNGRIRFIKGNHDLFKQADYDEYKNIDYVQGCGMLPGLGWVLTHIPIHERQFYGRWTHNVHGHTHCNRVFKIGRNKNEIIDIRYQNVSVEQINYTPISIEELQEKIELENNEKNN